MFLFLEKSLNDNRIRMEDESTAMSSHFQSSPLDEQKDGYGERKMCVFDYFNRNRWTLGEHVCALRLVEGKEER